MKMICMVLLSVLMAGLSLPVIGQQNNINGGTGTKFSLVDPTTLPPGVVGQSPNLTYQGVIYTCAGTTGAACTYAANPAALPTQADQTVTCNTSGGTASPVGCTPAQAAAVIKAVTTTATGKQTVVSTIGLPTDTPSVSSDQAQATSYADLFAVASCVEKYATSGMGSDYGQIINAAIQAQSLTIPSAIRFDCVDGSKSIATPIVRDRPVSFFGGNIPLIPTSALSTPEITLSGCTVTIGSENVTGCTATGGTPAVGYAIGGIGLLSGTYISAFTSAANFTVSLFPSITTPALTTSGSTTVTVTSLVGLAPGQTVFQVAGTSIPASTTIVSIAPHTMQMTLSNAATATNTVPIVLSVTAGTASSATTATAVTLTTTSQAPIINNIHNASALLNPEGQNIGASDHDVWIQDPGYRTLPGLVGVQINGWDRLNIDNYSCVSIRGSCLILGGYSLAAIAGPNGTAREADYKNVYFADSGNPLTGQSVEELMTGVSTTFASDEINQIGCIGCKWVFPYGEAITLGTYQTAHTTSNGPRRLTFTDNGEIEGGTHNTAYRYPANFAFVHCIQCADVYFGSLFEFANLAFGQAIIRSDQSDTITVSQGSLIASDDIAQSLNTYTVTVSNGSPTVTFVSGPTGSTSFPTGGVYDAAYVRVADTAACSPCGNYTLPYGAVAAGGATLTLNSPYVSAGCTNCTGTLAFWGGGFYFENTNLNRVFQATGGLWIDPSAQSLAGLQIASSNSLVKIGNQSVQTEIDDHGGTYTNAAVNGLSVRSVTSVGPLKGNALNGSGAVPTCVVGTGAGTGATCSLTGTNLGHVLTLNTGTTPASSATAVTVTFAGTITVAPSGCSATPRNAAAASVLSSIFTTAPSTSGYTIGVDTIALPASTSGISWYLPCI